MRSDLQNVDYLIHYLPLLPTFDSLGIIPSHCQAKISPLRRVADVVFCRQIKVLAEVADYIREIMLKKQPA